MVIAALIFVAGAALFWAFLHLGNIEQQRFPLQGRRGQATLSAAALTGERQGELARLRVLQRASALTSIVLLTIGTIALGMKIAHGI